MSVSMHIYISIYIYLSSFSYILAALGLTRRVGLRAYAVRVLLYVFICKIYIYI